MIVQPHSAPPLIQVQRKANLRELSGGLRVLADPDAAAAAADVPLVEQIAFGAAIHQGGALVVAGATRKTERQKDEGPFSGSGSPHLSGRQHRPRVGAVPAHLDGEGGRRAQLVPAVVELEEVVEEVMRTVPRKAA